MYCSSPPSYFFQYPPPTKQIVERIGDHMIRVPEFYFRVLDLMRNMNLPAPFVSDPATATKSMAAIGDNQGRSIDQNNLNGDNISERESDEEMDDGNDGNDRSECGKISNGIALSAIDRTHLKRLLTTAKSQPPKSLKSSQSIDHPSESCHRRIVISLHSAPSTSTSTLSSSVGEFGTFDPTPDPKSSVVRPPSPPFDLSTSLPLSQIRRGVIDRNEKQQNSLFKNYEPGSTCSRLYVKNISKKATKDDLRRLFGAFVSVESLPVFDICMMTKGKLHGQAFVSFANENQARAAIRETNGYKLYEKPIVVTFARSARK